MKHSLFLLQQSLLQKGLFSPYSPRLGVQTILNVTYLPDLLQYVKKQLLPEEAIRLQQHKLQNYLIELATTYKGPPQLQQLVSTIINYIRSKTQFWQGHNYKLEFAEQHAIATYKHDIEHLKASFKQEQKMVEFSPKYPRKTSTNFRYRVLHINNHHYSGVKDCLNHIPYIPQFLIQQAKKQNLETKLQQLQKDTQKLQMDNKESQTEAKLKKLIRQCIQFMLKNKTTKIAIKQTIFQSAQSDSNEQDGQLEREQRQDPSDDHRQSQHQKPVQKQKVIIDEFIQYLKGIPKMPKFPSGYHIYNLTHNLLLVCQRLKPTQDLKVSRLQENDKKPQPKTHQLKDSLDILQIPEDVKKILSQLSEKQIDQGQCQAILDCFLILWQTKLRFLDEQIQSKSSVQKRSWLYNQNELNSVKQAYNKMLEDPQYQELNKFTITKEEFPWNEQQYKKFLKGLAQFISIPTNNKKIATFMGSQIEQNHVKKVKANYLIVMKDRIARGECGGGKRAKCLSKREFIQNDLKHFSMKWFQKNRRIRRTKKDIDDDDEIDSQYS